MYSAAATRCVQQGCDQSRFGCRTPELQALLKKCRRQCEIINAFEQTPEGREEAEAWDRVAADAWEG